MFDLLKQYYETHRHVICPNCKHIFSFETPWNWLCAPHWFDKYRFTKCPRCRGWYWMEKTYWAKKK